MKAPSHRRAEENSVLPFLLGIKRSAAGGDSVRHLLKDETCSPLHVHGWINLFTRPGAKPYCLCSLSKFPSSTHIKMQMAASLYLAPPTLKTHHVSNQISDQSESDLDTGPKTGHSFCTYNGDIAL